MDILQPITSLNGNQKAQSAPQVQDKNLMMRTDREGRLFNHKKYSERCQNMYSSDQFDRKREFKQEIEKTLRRSECKREKTERKSKIEENIEKIQNKFTRAKRQNDQSQQKRNQLLIKIKMKDKNYFLSRLRSKLRKTSNLLKSYYPSQIQAQNLQKKGKSTNIGPQLICKQSYTDEANNLAKMVDGIHIYESQRHQKSARDKNMRMILQAMVGSNETKVANQQAVEIRQKLYEKQMSNCKSIQELQRERKRETNRRKRRMQVATKILNNKLKLGQNENGHSLKKITKENIEDKGKMYRKGQEIFQKVGCISRNIKSKQDKMNDYFNMIGHDFIAAQYLNLREPSPFESSKDKTKNRKVNQKRNHNRQIEADIVPENLLITLDTFYQKNKQKVSSLSSLRLLKSRNCPLGPNEKDTEEKENCKQDLNNLFQRKDIHICQKMSRMQEKRKKNQKHNKLQKINRLSDTTVISPNIGFGKIVQYF